MFGPGVMIRDSGRRNVHTQTTHLQNPIAGGENYTYIWEQGKNKLKYEISELQTESTSLIKLIGHC